MQSRIEEIDLAGSRFFLSEASAELELVVA
jgi:hypothetical protein